MSNGIGTPRDLEARIGELDAIFSEMKSRSISLPKISGKNEQTKYALFPIISGGGYCIAASEDIYVTGTGTLMKDSSVLLLWLDPNLNNTPNSKIFDGRPFPTQPEIYQIIDLLLDQYAQQQMGGAKAVE